MRAAGLEYRLGRDLAFETAEGMLRDGAVSEEISNHELFCLALIHLHMDSYVHSSPLSAAHTLVRVIARAVLGCVTGRKWVLRLAFDQRASASHEIRANPRIHRQTSLAQRPTERQGSRAFQLWWMCKEAAALVSEEYIFIEVKSFD